MQHDPLFYQPLSTPNALALIHGDQHWTYTQLNEQVAHMTGWLADAGVQAANHVAVLLPNTSEYVCLIHALARLQAVIVPLNLRLTPPELAYQLQEADCHFVVCNAETAEKLPPLSSTTTLLLPALLPPRSSPFTPPPFTPSAPATIVFTSGTTGKPKGAVLTYDNFLWGAMASAYRLGTHPTDRWLLCMPLYHVGGLSIVWRCCLYGITAVLQPRFHAPSVNQAIDQQAITLVSLVPTMLQQLLEEREERPFPTTLRCVLLGGAAAPPSLLQKCHNLGIPIALTYGLTEAASQLVTAVPNQPPHKLGSVGKPLLFNQICILDQHHQPASPGEIGEIVATGPTLMQGYYHQPAATAKTLQNGWLHTGDMGYLDADGDLWVVQRRSDLIVTGGENVYPTEVEQVLLSHPAVQAACVVGIPDETWGQKVGTAVVLHPNTAITTTELLAYCRQHLAGYKQPRLLHFVPALPLTASGKIHRQAVTEQLQNL